MLKLPILPPSYYLPRDLIQLDRRPARDRWCKLVQGKKQPAGQEKAQGEGVGLDELQAVGSLSGAAQQ